MFSTQADGNNATGSSHTIYRDSDCNGPLNGKEGVAVIHGINFGITASNRLCIINKVYAPTNVVAQDAYKVKTTAKRIISTVRR